MDKLSECISTLEDAGLDVIEVGCRWQEKSPFTLADFSELMTGLMIMTASVLLFWVVTELGNEYFD